MSDPLLSSVRSALLIAAVTAATVLVALAADGLDMAIYALSFWHYFVYALAFSFRQVPHDRFKLDAVLLKAISLTFFAIAVLQSTPNLGALIVMAAGFGLNIAAASRLGVDRTYYGVELAGMPPRWTTTFPYSMMAHPMLLGSMAAYGGALFDAEFREGWWPLAIIHVLLNLLMIIMEAHSQLSRARAMLMAWSALAVGGALVLFCFTDLWHSAAACSVIMLAFGSVLIRQYTRSQESVQSGETLQ